MNEDNQYEVGFYERTPNGTWEIWFYGVGERSTRDHCMFDGIPDLLTAAETFSAYLSREAASTKEVVTEGKVDLLDSAELDVAETFDIVVRFLKCLEWHVQPDVKVVILDQTETEVVLQVIAPSKFEGNHQELLEEDSSTDAGDIIWEEEPEDAASTDIPEKKETEEESLPALLEDGSLPASLGERISEIASLILGGLSDFDVPLTGYWEEAYGCKLDCNPVKLTLGMEDGHVVLRHADVTTWNGTFLRSYTKYELAMIRRAVSEGTPATWDE